MPSGPWAASPQVVRSDNTSAATHELRSSRGRALNDNYAALLDHYGLRSTRINPGQSHENGVAERAHYRLRRHRPGPHPAGQPRF